MPPQEIGRPHTDIIGDSNAKAVISVLNNGRTNVRRNAAVMLGMVDPDVSDRTREMITGALMAALHDKDLSTRSYALSSLFGIDKRFVTPYGSDITNDRVNEKH